MSEMFKNFKRKKKKNQKPRQEWDPHWSLKGLYGIYHGATAVLKVALGAVATVLLIVLICGFVFVGILGDYLQTDILPSAVEDLEGYDLEQTSFIYYIDDDGDIQELQKIYTSTDRRWATIDEIPQDLIDAAVAIEDKRFYEHQGVDWITTVKACANMFIGSSSTFGGSTITQQFIKNKTGDDDVTVQRKLIEIFKAIYFESRYDKDVVMEWYLNTIYFGYNKYGVRAAAEQYFGKELELLSTAECAALIGITNNPSLFNPFSESEYEYPKGKGVVRDGAGRNRYRQENILWSMWQEGYLTKEEYEAAMAETLEFRTGISDMDRLAHCPDTENCGYFGTVSTFASQVENGIVYHCPSCGAATEVDLSGSQGVYSWFTEAVMDDVCKGLAAKDGKDWEDLTAKEKEAYLEQLKIGGYHIYSTIDMEVQAELDKVYTDLSQIPTTKSTQQLWSAMVIIDNETGDIVAIAGNVGEKTAYDALSYATEAKLQTGSTQKPLAIYAPAFEMGLITPASVIKDMPHHYNDGSPFPRNDNRKYQYARSIYSGIVSSVNAISVNTLDKIGLQESYDFAKNKFRLQGLTDSYIASNGQEMSDVGWAPMGMGALTTGVTVRDMTAAYATFANNGVYREARTYTKVYDSDGNLVLDNTQETEQILSEKTVNYMNYCLTAAVESGTGGAAQISGQIVAGKTGTTSSNRDRWFCGFTDHYTAAVWCGYQWPEAIKLTGDTRNPACRLFAKVLTPVHEGLEKVKLYDSSNFRSYSMCLDSGLRATGSCSHTTSAYAYSGDVNVDYCDKHKSVEYCVTGKGVATEYCKLMGASVSSTSLVKMSADDVSAVRKALSCGLSGGYPEDSRVYYTGGSWHGYSGNLQSGVSQPYIVCTTHTAAAYEQYQQAQTPDPEEPTEPGTGEAEPAPTHNDHNHG